MTYQECLRTFVWMIQVQVKCACRFVRAHAQIFACARTFQFCSIEEILWGILYIEKKHPSLKHAATCRSLSHPHHGHNYSTHHTKSPPPKSILSDSDRSSGKIYLPPLTNASVTCESPSSRRRPLEINHRTKSTSILFLCYPQTKSPLPKSILVRFGLGK